MIWLWAYLCMGGVNVLAAHAQGILMLRQKARDGEGLWFFAEAAFYFLLWPLQMGFWMLVWINNGSSVVLSRIFNGKPDRGGKHKR